MLDSPPSTSPARFGGAKPVGSSQGGEPRDALLMGHLNERACDRRQGYRTNAPSCRDILANWLNNSLQPASVAVQRRGAKTRLPEGREVTPMKMRLAGLIAAALVFTPMAASAQYHGGQRHRDHDRSDGFRHGGGGHGYGHARRHHHHGYDRPVHFERRHHHRHFD